MKRLQILIIALLGCALSFAQEVEVYSLYKDNTGISFGKVNNITGVFTKLSGTLSFGAYSSTLDAINGHFIYRSQELQNVNTSKLYTIDIKTGQVVNSINTGVLNEGIKSLEYNIKDSTLYALYKDNTGISFGKVNNKSGAFTKLSGTLSFGAYSSTLDAINGHFIYRSQELPNVNTSKLYTIDIKTGQVVNSISTGVLNEGIKSLEYNIKDSILYALYQHSGGVSFGKVNNITGVYTKLTDTLSYGSYSSTLDAISGYFIYRSQELPNVNTSKLYTIDIKTGQVVNSINTGVLNEGIIQMEVFVKKLKDTTITSINEQVANTNISIYPNPSSGSFSLQLQQPLQNASLQITNSMGLVIYSQSYSNLQNITINATGFASGLYNVSISNGNTSFSKKLVVY